jgi:hypothetical protein
VSEVWGTLEIFRASDKRISSDFNKYLKYLNIFKITSSNNGYRPSSPKAAMFVVTDNIIT